MNKACVLLLGLQLISFASEPAMTVRSFAYQKRISPLSWLSSYTIKADPVAFRHFKAKIQEEKKQLAYQHRADEMTQLSWGLGKWVIKAGGVAVGLGVLGVGICYFNRAKNKTVEKIGVGSFFAAKYTAAAIPVVATVEGAALINHRYRKPDEYWNQQLSGFQAITEGRMNSISVKPLFGADILGFEFIASL